MKDVSGWMRNNPWEPWCLVMPRATEAGDAIHAMRAIEAESAKRGNKPSLLALPVGEVPAQPMSRKQLRKLRRDS